MLCLHRMLLLAAILTLANLTAHAQSPPPVDVQMSVLPGLKFETPRFAVTPGAKVIIRLKNPDQMIHNFVITAPGARMDVVMAALALGADGPAKNYIPDSPKVLWHTKALNPGESDELTFTAPAEEGIYPYVCTFTGHGFVMYGAMYVTTKPLPPLESDANLPPATPEVTEMDHSQHPLTKTTVVRTFLPDCGPAAIAIGLTSGTSYCFDAGLCRMRYAWKGGFVDNAAHWRGKGDEMGKVVGRIWYRAPAWSPLRIGNSEAEPALRWRGYQWKKGEPQLEYTADGMLVRESPKALEGGSGIVLKYAIESQGEPVYFKTDPDGGAEFSSSAGTWKDGVLSLTSEQAREFTITMKERPGIEPLQYWSMNDLVFPNKKDPEPGVIGNAFTPGGTDGKPRVLDTEIKLSDLGKGGTVMLWYRSSPKAKPGGTILGTAEDSLLPATAANPAWTHFAIAAGEHHYISFFNGVSVGTTDYALELAHPDSTLTIGSRGPQDFFDGLIDEVRIYDHILPPDEIAAIYKREAAYLPKEEAPK